jgi:hypothetical protein
MPSVEAIVKVKAAVVVEVVEVVEVLEMAEPFKPRPATKCLGSKAVSVARPIGVLPASCLGARRERDQQDHQRKQSKPAHASTWSACARTTRLMAAVASKRDRLTGSCIIIRSLGPALPASPARQKNAARYTFSNRAIRERHERHLSVS